jgi:threonine dehydrogenase-like Zn-dependent dehydrogenase
VSKKFVITKKGIGSFEEEKEPRPTDGEILCKPLSVGLCGTDRLIFNGQMPEVTFPIVPCHEVSAVVVSDNSNLSLCSGTVVCIDPYRNCGKCHACKLGRYNCCEFNQTLGV